MRQSLLISILFCAMLTMGFAQSIHYNLRMEKPAAHYFQVEMVVKDFKKSSLEFKLPVWAPGSYLVREFSKNLDLVKATDKNGKALQINKSNKNTWVVDTKNVKEVHINYEVYSFELTVRTSFLDNTHGFVSGSGVFMYLNNAKDVLGTLDVYPHSSFSKITTALNRSKESEVSDEKTSFEFKDYDQLVDCPIEIGNQETFSFNAAGLNHDVGIYGRGNHDIEQLKIDMPKIIESATSVFGVNPNKNYTFIIHNVENGQGGLEHINSTTLSVNRWTYEGSKYIGFLSLVAHEYFHLWNVKRIRPIELGPFNYDEENYTTLLWVMEGFTSYYDELLLLRAGYYDKDTYLRKLNGTLNYVEGSTGSRIQPLAHASYDAWIKAYRPNENSVNTTMSYYSRGQMMAMLFDAMIIDKYKGEKGLDDFMQILYNKYYLGKKRGFTEDEFKTTLEELLGYDLSDFFKKYIHGTEIPDYKTVLEKVGIVVQDVSDFETSFGSLTRNSGNSAIVTRIRRESAAEVSGLSVGDEIIAIDDIRVDSDVLDAILESMTKGDTFELIISRDNLLMKLDCKMDDYFKTRFNFELDDKVNTVNSNYWLRSNK
ncbi:MAG: putative metalloprotease with PDZ domain [Lentimonas sp.]|jgi:predicted metalloprotease with PDZ domain